MMKVVMMFNFIQAQPQSGVPICGAVKSIPKAESQESIA
jgi:hypothetical protein